MKSFLLILLTFWCVTVRSEILFSDDFETYNQPSDLLIANGGKWNSVLGEKHVQISTTEHFSGSKSLEMDMPVTSTEFSIGPSRYFSPKRPELHVRSYIKYAPNFYLPVQSSHKGMTFAGSMPGPCIKTPTDGTGFFSFTLQNNVESKYQPGELFPGFGHIYAYWPYQRSDCGDHWYPTGRVLPWVPPYGWGLWILYPQQYPGFHAMPNFNVPLGKWFCYELMVKVNDLGKKNGEVKAWLDGNVVMDFPDLFIRSVDSLAIDVLHLRLHCHHSEQVNKMWYDDVVVSTSCIGP